MKISEKTIRCTLCIDFGIKSYKPAQKPGLTEAIKKKRLKIAESRAFILEAFCLTFFKRIRQK